MLKYFTINTTAEVVCLIIALMTLVRVQQQQWRSMILFMFIICVTEFGGIYIEYSVPGRYTRNEWLYNLLLIFQVGFISGMFYHLLQDYLPVRWIFGGELLILIGLYIGEIMSHGFTVYNQITNTAMLVFISLSSLSYYYFLIRDTRYVRLTIHPDFWWVTGIFFFYFGTTACNVFYHQLASNFNENIKLLTYHIYNAFIFVLYGCWSYAFICKRWKTKMSPV